MAGQNQELANQFGRFNLEAGALFSISDVQRMGDMQLMTLQALLMLMFFDDGRIQPLSGVAGSGQLTAGAQSHLQVTKGAGDLDLNIAAGFGMAYTDSALGASAFLNTSYRPVVLAVNTTATVGTHDATNPRIDNVVARAVNFDDQPEARQTRTTINGQPTDPVPTINLRRMQRAQIVVIPGTPAATPAAPSFNPDTGDILLAQVDVPATSGPIVVRDEREFLQLGQSFQGQPVAHLTEQAWVRDTGSFATISLTGLVASISGGFATVNGVERRVPPSTLALDGATGGGPNSVIHILYIDDSGKLETIMGTSDVNPDPPDTSGVVGALLYQVRVTDAVQVGSPIDLRSISWVPGERITGDIRRSQLRGGVQPISVGGAAFAAGDAGDRSEGSYRPGVGAGDLGAGIQLPHGVTVTQIQLIVDAEGAGGGLTVTGTLERTALFGAAEAQDTMGSAVVNTVADTQTIASDTSITNAVVDNSQYAYSLRITFAANGNNANITIRGMLVFFSTD